MTEVLVRITDAAGDPARGPLTFTPTARAVIPGGVLAAVPVSIGSTYRSLAASTVHLEPTPPLTAPSPWCYRVDEPGGTTRHVTVPPTGPVAYTDLPDVDPTSLAPATAPERAWALALSEVVARVAALEAGAPPPVPTGHVATYLEDTL